MAYTKARREANERYNDEHYNKITVRVPAFRRELVEDLALQNNMSVNKYINVAIASLAGVSPEAWYNKDLKSNPLPGPHSFYTTPIVFRAPYFALAALQHTAEKEGSSVDVIINNAIAEYLNIDQVVWNGEYWSEARNKRE